MSEISFHYLQKQDFFAHASRLFEILHTNMTAIAPTENSYDEDFQWWSNAFGNDFAK